MCEVEFRHPPEHTGSFPRRFHLLFHCARRAAEMGLPSRAVDDESPLPRRAAHIRTPSVARAVRVRGGGSSRTQRDTHAFPVERGASEGSRRALSSLSSPLAVAPPRPRPCARAVDAVRRPSARRLATTRRLPSVVRRPSSRRVLVRVRSVRSSVEGLYRNPLSAVYALLEERHPGGTYQVSTLLLGLSF